MTVIRGAISVEKNTKKEIIEKAIQLYKTIIMNNNSNNIFFVLGTQTKDLNSYNCITALRENSLLYSPAQCVQEVFIKNTLKKIIRLNIFCNDNFIPKHIYLDKAILLRPDLEIKNDAS